MSGVALPSPEPRRVSTPCWLDLRLVAGVVLVLACVLIGAAVVSRARSTETVVAARRDLAAGTVLHADDLHVVQAQVPADGRAVYARALNDAVGRTLSRPLARGEFVPLPAVARVKALTTLTVPFAAGAVPVLRDGQRIEVWLSTATCASVVLLDDVTVQDVRNSADGSFSSGSGGQDVVISVPPAQADRVIAALAIDQAKIRAGVLLGSPTAPTSSAPSSSAPPVTGTGPRGLPADLAACTSASPTR